MSGTSAHIIVKLDNKFKVISVLLDGYPENVGQILQKYYCLPAFAEDLVQPGNIYSLGKYCSQPPPHLRHDRFVNVTHFSVYQARDCGAPQLEAAPQIYSEWKRFWPKQLWGYYAYYWGGEEWLMSRKKTNGKWSKFKPL